MDGAGKIAAGMVVSSVVLVTGWIGYHEYARQRDLDEGARVMREALDAVTPKRMVVIPDPERVRLEAQAAPVPWNGLTPGPSKDLRAGEACFNGEVIQQTAHGIFHETHADGSTVRCEGNRRL
jgi:hypothetical protein